MVYYDDVFILFRHLFLSQLVRCSFVVPSVPASMSSRQSKPPTKAHLCYFVAIFLIEASESFMVHHDDLFIVFRHFFPSSSGHCSCASVAISTLHKRLRTHRNRDSAKHNPLLKINSDVFPKHWVLVPPTQCFEGHVIKSCKNITSTEKKHVCN